MIALLEWLAFLLFIAGFSLAFGFYMLNRKRPPWRKVDQTEPSHGKHQGTSADLDPGSGMAA